MGGADVVALEGRRLEQQRRLDEQQGLRARNRLGQFATPPALALEMAHLVRHSWDRGMPVHFGDPAAGSGAFFSALLNVFPPGQVSSATGVEIDLNLVATARELWGPLGLETIAGDFTNDAVRRCCARRPTLLLANPPYV